MEKYSYLKSSHATYIEQLQDLYHQDPDALDPSWRYFFEGLELESTQRSAALTLPAPLQSIPSIGPSGEPATLRDQTYALEKLVVAYREQGHHGAQTNPLGEKSTRAELDLKTWKVSGGDQTPLPPLAGMEYLTVRGIRTLGQLVTHLQKVYTTSVGVELGSVTSPTERKWLENELENGIGLELLSAPERQQILRRLTQSETFERFLHTRYVAQKRFSLEGAEALIPGLDVVLREACSAGARELVIGMAHRGRLNTLVNFLGQDPANTFTQFEGHYPQEFGEEEGDVKYHMGYSTELTLDDHHCHVSLAFNPSHLEFVGAVIEGMARAKQDHHGKAAQDAVVPISIHGDASFAGQGVCYETLNFSRLAGYRTGGTIHIVINNQVGFTATPQESRSTPYCTDLAKMLGAPIFHVNGDDPEAVCRILRVATRYRQRFKQDVFVDLVCYRKYGHNEGDEPAFTQPLETQRIKSHPSPREIYAQRLIAENIVDETQAQAWINEATQGFTQAQAAVKANPVAPHISSFEGPWKNYHLAHGAALHDPVDTRLAATTLQSLGKTLQQVPEGFQLNPKLQRLLESRQKALEAAEGLDWGNAEALAFASLLHEGYTVRVSGQDAERGTFSHRHAVWHDTQNGRTHTPLASIGPKFTIVNSHLSETAVLGFEYGYSTSAPESLVIWEAQFGDFANGAQVIIDQFIATGESKWKRSSGLVLLLPHGYEGQAAEHSSGRIERFLQLCGRDNLGVINPTTPSQLFHALRRQMKRPFKKPLVVFSPKSLLRNPAAISKLRDLAEGQFQPVIGDPSITDQTEQILLCSGKIYYELVAARARQQAHQTAIVRLEQFYPWPAAQLRECFLSAPRAALTWVQEEPRNMGAWTFVSHQWHGGLDRFSEEVGGRCLRYAGRTVAASPAVGSHHRHEIEQAELIQAALVP